MIKRDYQESISGNILGYLSPILCWFEGNIDTLVVIMSYMPQSIYSTRHCKVGTINILVFMVIFLDKSTIAYTKLSSYDVSDIS